MAKAPSAIDRIQTNTESVTSGLAQSERMRGVSNLIERAKIEADIPELNSEDEDQLPQVAVYNDASGVSMERKLVVMDAFKKRKAMNDCDAATNKKEEQKLYRQMINMEFIVG